MSNKKPRTLAQRQKFYLGAGAPAGPTRRTPAAALPVLTAEEQLHERLEERRLRKAWDENRLTASLRGHDSVKR
jgi:hypothetical protein